jgi:hypothetical protein
MQPTSRMTSVPATANEVRDVLGDVDDLVVERVLETGASVEEIASAMASLEYQQVLGERGSEVVTGPTLTVRAILEECLAEPEGDEDVIPASEDLLGFS